MKTIPGALDASALTLLSGAAPGNKHAPKNRLEYARVAQSMASQGLRVDDIATTLNITRQGVLDLLAEALPDDRGKLQRWTR